MLHTLATGCTCGGARCVRLTVAETSGPLRKASPASAAAPDPGSQQSPQRQTRDLSGALQITPRAAAARARTAGQQRSTLASAHGIEVHVWCVARALDVPTELGPSPGSNTTDSGLTRQGDVEHARRSAQHLCLLCPQLQTPGRRCVVWVPV